MTHIRVSILAACLTAGSLSSVEAATKKVRVPNKYDGSWTIMAMTAQGPCSANTNYQVQINAGSASVPGEDINIGGGVSTGGAVQVTIIKGPNTVPITGKLNPNGSGSGTWRTSGGFVDCSGSWSAKRLG